ncbi:MAG: DUF445 family protein [Clostridia bacterium]|nr:DUF445 family protein [Clostridia bacterium]MBR2464047.1 DUF445 family protein [Clostridia bacterium]MBR3863004.1 DUF445 family protein [Clostridia bacterium]
MENFLKIVSLLAGPVVGAIIGIFTNYIAVKMLFRPYREKRIGKCKLPFTPGIIPRRQPALAAALGRMVSEKLVREEDLKRALLSDELTNTVVNSILSLPPLRESGKLLVGETYDVQRDRLLNLLVDKIVAGIAGLDLAEIFKREGAGIAAGISQKNPLIGMFLNEGTISSLATPLSDRILMYLEGDGKLKLREILDGEASKLEEKPIGEMFGDREKLQPLLVSVYRKLVSEHADSIAARFHIADIVEERVRAMPPEDLEKLILSVMKKELNDVIRLGAVIGFIMGIVTTVINMI